MRVRVHAAKGESALVLARTIILARDSARFAPRRGIARRKERTRFAKLGNISKILLRKSLFLLAIAIGKYVFSLFFSSERASDSSRVSALRLAIPSRGGATLVALAF